MERDAVENEKKHRAATKNTKRDEIIAEDRGYVRLPLTRAEQIMRKIFDSLTADDFLNHDVDGDDSRAFTESFHRGYTAHIQHLNDRKKRFMRYETLKAKNATRGGSEEFAELEEEFGQARLADLNFKVPDIYSYYFSTISKANPLHTNDNVVEVCAYIFPSGKAVEIARNKVMDVLADFLQKSNMEDSGGASLAQGNDGSAATVGDETDVHDYLSGELRDEISDMLREQGKVLRTDRKNPHSQRNNKIRSIYNKLMENFKKIRGNEMLCRLVSTVNVLEVPEYGLRDSQFKMTNGSVLPRRASGASDMNARGGARINVLNNLALSEVYNRGVSAVLVTAGSQIIPGGQTDMGIESNDTPLILSTTIGMAYATIADDYPLSDARILYFPNVMVLRDFTDSEYPLLQQGTGKNIAVIDGLPKYHPTTNIAGQDMQILDARLYLPSTHMMAEDRAKRQICNIFELAKHLGYAVIIFDDFGAEDFWLPPYHMAKVFSDVAAQYKRYFREIIFSIEKPQLYAIYKEIIRT